MGVYIPVMKMPDSCIECKLKIPDDEYDGYCPFTRVVCLSIGRQDDCPLIEIPTPHGRLIDANKLEAMMYHEAFEIDSDMQKWDSGCWIRYKVFENCMNRLLPDTILEAEGGDAK